MIRAGGILHIIGLFLLVLAATMLVPLAYAVLDGTDSPRSFGYSVGLTAVTGLVLAVVFRAPASELLVREGILLVVLTWGAVSLFGSLPFYFSPHFPTFTDAFFEAVSGFTTTGATVLIEVEVLPEATQLWRCFSHWLGGLGIVLLGIAILPLLGTGGMQLYRAEFSGAKSEKLKPRITETALALWRIYVALTLALYVALRLAGVNRFEAACHAFSTLGTGGFSSRTASVAGFASPVVEYIVIVFMLLAGISFVWHYRVWVERRARYTLADVEVRAFLLLVLVSTAVITLSLVFNGGYDWQKGFRASLFQVTSIATTTGFVTDDFERWPALPQMLLLALMFVGGCTGSTAGGMKVARIQLLRRLVSREFKKTVERRGVFAIRLGEQVIPESAVQSLLNLVYLALAVNFGSCLLLAALGVDVLTSIAAVTASLFNIGPGLGHVGPAEHYGHLPALAKWVLCGCMVAGRLEFYTALAILSPAFWRK